MSGSAERPSIPPPDQWRHELFPTNPHLPPQQKVQATQVLATLSGQTVVQPADAAAVGQVSAAPLLGKPQLAAPSMKLVNAIPDQNAPSLSAPKGKVQWDQDLIQMMQNTGAMEIALATCISKLTKESGEIQVGFLSQQADWTKLVSESIGPISQATYKQNVAQANIYTDQAQQAYFTGALGITGGAFQIGGGIGALTEEPKGKTTATPDDESTVAEDTEDQVKAETETLTDSSKTGKKPDSPTNNTDVKHTTAEAEDALRKAEADKGKTAEEAAKTPKAAKRAPGWGEYLWKGYGSGGLRAGLRALGAGQGSLAMGLGQTFTSIGQIVGAGYSTDMAQQQLKVGTWQATAQSGQMMTEQVSQASGRSASAQKTFEDFKSSICQMYQAWAQAKAQAAKELMG